MKEWMITNCVVWGCSSLAIAVACKVTKSAMPLWAFLLLPKWTISEKNGGEND